jgi:hypothetical protein
LLNIVLSWGFFVAPITTTITTTTKTNVTKHEGGFIGPDGAFTASRPLGGLPQTTRYAGGT